MYGGIYTFCLCRKYQRHTPAESLRFFVIPFAYAHFNKKSLYTFPQEAVKNISLGVISLMRLNQSHRFFLLVGKKNQCGLKILRAGALAGLAKGAGHLLSRTDIMTTFSTAAASAGKMQPSARVCLCLLSAHTESRSQSEIPKRQRLFHFFIQHKKNSSLNFQSRERKRRGAAAEPFFRQTFVKLPSG